MAPPPNEFETPVLAAGSCNCSNSYVRSIVPGPPRLADFTIIRPTSRRVQFIFSPHDLRSRSADRREILHRDRKYADF